jgi:hypothetical protein
MAEPLGPASSQHRSTRATKALRGAGEIATRGGRLLRLTFPETRAQQTGQAVVLYGRYKP